MSVITWWERYRNCWVAAWGERERGASLVEYALLLALIAVVCVGAITFIGGSANDALSRAGSTFP